ncbi:hypothetical protein ABE59_18490 [Bacillus safensis]|nr:hypothetical protein [Bacillus safensis]MBW0258951.1 hypothetical protein [Bacillus sp. F2HM]
MPNDLLVFTCFSFQVINCWILTKATHIINNSINLSLKIRHTITTKNNLIEYKFVKGVLLNDTRRK